ncbi:MAG: hypothetical protein JXA93_17610 [Anaerolineae bacterium]|nr:hypothetical protein [Anaerolineae bacterium]
MTTKRFRTARLLLLPAALLFLSVVTLPPAAAQPPGLQIKVDAAFDGYGKYGEWLPLSVEIANSGADLQAELRVRVPRGTTHTFATPADLPTGSRKRFPLYVLPNNYSHELQVELIDRSGGDRDGDVIASRKVPVQPRPNITYFVGLLAPERGALSLIEGMSLGTQNRPKQLVDVSLADLPERAEGLRSFDCLVLNDVDTSTLTPAQAAAIEGWVQAGGRLVIGGGAGARATASGLPDSLLPVIPFDTTTLDVLPGLATFAGTSPVRVPGPFLAATGDLNPGVNRAVHGPVPLVRERSVGDGLVDFIALDLAAAPFDAWTGTIPFWQALLSPGADYPSWLPQDMSARESQAQSMVYSLLNLPALDLPSIGALATLLAVYIVLVGPVNYIVLRRARRLQWAWITIPALTLLFSAGAFGLGYALRGSNVIVNQIGIAYLSPGGDARYNSYVGIFSPHQQSYEIEVQGGGLVAPLNPAYDPWGQGGAMGGGEVVFVQSSPAQVQGLAVNQWSMQTFMTEGTWEDLGTIRSELTLEKGTLAGMIQNDTGYPLHDAVLLIGDDIARLGDVPPGEAAGVSLNIGSLSSTNWGMPLGWRLFEEELNKPRSGAPPREVQMKQSILDNVFRDGRFQIGGSATDASAPHLLAWIHTVSPEIRVDGKEPQRQAISLLYTPLAYSLPEDGTISLPPGIIPGSVVQMPSEGGLCGPSANAVWLGRGEAVFEFSLPEELDGADIRSLSLAITSDGGRWDPPETAIYDWNRQEWRIVDGAILGVNTLSEPGALVGAGGLVRVRLSTGAGRVDGCFQVRLGLEAERQPAGSGEGGGARVGERREQSQL